MWIVLSLVEYLYSEVMFDPSVHVDVSQHHIGHWDRGIVGEVVIDEPSAAAGLDLGIEEGRGPQFGRGGSDGVAAWNRSDRYPDVNEFTGFTCTAAFVVRK